MTPKDKVTERLQKLAVVEGVASTAAVRSGPLGETAHLIRRNEIDAAVRTAAGHLRETQRFALGPAVSLLTGSHGVREQVAGFAEAGINLFVASPELLALPLSERAENGASGIVSRVLLSDQRLLLETPRVIVRFKEGTESKRASVLKKHNAIAIDSSGLPPNTMRASLIDGTAVTRSLEMMRELEVEYAEPDFIEHVGQRFTPTDAEFVNQWHHKNIKSEDAWDHVKGEGVRVVVIDNGFDTAHPDLRFGPLSGWFRETADRADADFVPGTTGMRNGNHGTACAGMIAARSRDGSGGCGVAFASGLSMVGCLGDQVGPQSTLARAVAYAARPSLESGAPPGAVGGDIISCSLGPNNAQWQIRQVLSDAIDFAATQGRGGKGCAIFWACTNGNFPIASDEVCSHANVIAVGRSRKEDQDDGSGFGPELKFLAPGVQVRIPAQGGRYQNTTGTSFAAPCAAGVAALALAAHSELKATDLLEILGGSCDEIGNLPYIKGPHDIKGRHDRFGYGRVNAKRVVAEAQRRAAIA